MTQAFFVDAKSRFCLMLYDVINYNDVISAADSFESVKDVRFTDCEKYCCQRGGCRQLSTTGSHESGVHCTPGGGGIGDQCQPNMPKATTKPVGCKSTITGKNFEERICNDRN